MRPLLHKNITKAKKISLPVAHGDGNYYVSEDEFKELQNNNQIVFYYKDNPNGSVYDIAGICNKAQNVLGMMPHPERAMEPLLGNDQGKKLFQSIISSMEG